MLSNHVDTLLKYHLGESESKRIIGKLTSLNTQNKGDIVSAINEINTKISTLKLESTSIEVVDKAENFNADSSGKKLLEDILVQINEKVKANSAELGTNKTDLYRSQVEIINTIQGIE